MQINFFINSRQRRLKSFACHGRGQHLTNTATHRIQQYSGGLITYRDKDGITEFLLLHYVGGHWDFPKGKLEIGEDAVAAAHRELEEETGYTSKNWISLGKLDVNPAYMTNTCETFLALDAIKTSEQNLDPFEEIEVCLEDLENIAELVKTKKITHSLIVAAFYFLQLQRSHLD